MSSTAPGPPNPSSTLTSSRAPHPPAESSLCSSLLQQQAWVPDAAPASCFGAHLHLGEAPHLQNEPGWGAHTFPVQELPPGLSFSLSSNAEQLPIIFAVFAI